MSLDDRARRATDGVRRAVGNPQTLERFHRYRVRRQRNRQLGAGLLAIALAVSGLVLVERAFHHVSRPAAPRPGGVILYGRWLPDRQEAHWYTIRPDGSGVVDLHLVTTCATWWPDGSRILITNDAAQRGSGGPLRPATMRSDGSGLRPLNATTDRDLNLGCGGVSPDGTRLVLEGFNDNDRAVNGIYTVRASDGGGLMRLTRSPADGADGSPAYSPDGRQVAFFRSKPGSSPNGSGALFVVNADGTSLRRITPWGFAFLTQSWSPDGRWIAFERPYGQLYLVHPDGSGLHRIPLQLPPASGASNPAWSPDGNWIAFSLSRNEQANIFIVRPDGTDLTQATHAAGVDAQTPDWGTSAT